MSRSLTKRFAITTPERVTFHYEPAGLATRTMAWLIDQAIMLGLRVCVIIVLARLGELGFALVFIAMLLIDLGYFTWFEWRWAGQTPGKRAMKIYVASATGSLLRGEDVLLRNLLRPVDNLPLMMTLGGIIAWLDPYGRRLGDLAAGTLVIRAAARQLPQAIFDANERENVFWSDAAIRNRILARVTRDERDFLMDLVQRRDQLASLPRHGLFQQALAYFQQRYNLPEQEHLTAEQAVLNVALVVRDPRSAAVTAQSNLAGQPRPSH